MTAKRWSPQGRSLKLITACLRYFDEYSASITLKQLFYLMVAEGLLRNDEASWRKLKTVTLKARKHGRIPATALSLNKHPVDTRYAVEPDEYIQKMLRDFRIPRTYGQNNYIEIWVEREPLNIFVEHLLGEYDIPVYVTGGYANYNFIYSAAQRLKDSTSRKGSPRVVYLSDFSASSFKMFEMLSEELGGELGLTRQEVSSILFKAAVVPEQFIKYNLPKCFTPSKEEKSARFTELYGDVMSVMGLESNTCVEIESLNPKDFSNILHNIVFGLMDQNTMAEVARKEADSIAKLKDAIDGE